MIYKTTVFLSRMKSTITDNQEGQDLDAGKKNSEQCPWNSIMEQW